MASSEPSGRPPLWGTPPNPLPRPPTGPNTALRRCWRAQWPSTSDASRPSDLLPQRVKSFFDRAGVSSRRLAQSFPRGNSVRTEFLAPSDERVGLARSRGGPTPASSGGRLQSRVCLRPSIPAAASHPHHMGRVEIAPLRSNVLIRCGRTAPQPFRFRRIKVSSRPEVPAAPAGSRWRPILNQRVRFHRGHVPLSHVS